MTTLIPDLYNDPHLTIFAPANSAFEQTFDELEMRYLWGLWGGEGRERVLGGHAVLDVKRGRKDGPVVGWRSNVSLKGGTLCEFSRTLFRSRQGAYCRRGYFIVQTIDNRTISLERNETGHLTANGTKINTPDVFAENGVIHLTSHLILPPRFQLLDDPGKVMLALNASRFVGLLEKTGLAGEYITRRREGGWTFLVPTDEVIEDARRDISGAVDENEDELEEMLRYHILPGRLEPKDLTDGALAQTELVTSLLKGNRQRVRVHVDRDTEDGAVSDLRFGAAAVVGEPCESRQVV
jgi:solute carrier family 25 carnitine/acylcarnitine transporter 20/29